MGQRILDLRVARGLTQIQLATETGVSRAHIGKMETGGDPPGREVLSKLAQYFRVSMDFLQSGGDSPVASPADPPSYDSETHSLLTLWSEASPSVRAEVLRLLRASAANQALIDADGGVTAPL